MIDHSRPAVDHACLPEFTPVPRLRERHDGWTPERQRRFIEQLADLGSVRAAAHAVNMSPESAYQLRRHPEAAEFRTAWEVALSLGVQRLEDVAMDRALNGVEVPVYAFGKIVGHRTVYNDALLMFILRNRATYRFNADNQNNPEGVTLAQREALKKLWRKEWERERAIRHRAESEEILLSINAKLEQMKQRRIALAREDGEDLSRYGIGEPDDDDETEAPPGITGDDETPAERDESRGGPRSWEQEVDG